MKITGGQYKGRRINVPAGISVRPTSDRMRQSLFNIVMHAPWSQDINFEMASVMDLFCGSGALGLEALSRGAAHCTFIDNAPLSLKFVKENTAFLDKESYSIIKASAMALGQRSASFMPRNFVFMDPPYKMDMVSGALMSLIKGEWLADQAVIIAETEKNAVIEMPPAFEKIDHRIQGASELHILRYHAAIE